MEGVISVFRSKMLKLHTTRSWDFMGLTLDYSAHSIPMQLKYGDDVIVAIFDTGVWPESESFREESNLGPIPKSWRGKCVKADTFDPATACNRKLIGARFYLAGFELDYGPLNATGFDAEFRSPRDRLGHGTHTASTAVGSISSGVNFYGLGSGNARGGAPRARLAVYKICWFKDLEGRCSEADIMAAFDDALNDGVHVISASLGSSPPLMPFFSMSTDIGSFHAMQMGVTVVFSAGNEGPDTSLVQNVSPWGMCVGASTIDRGFPTKITLGNNVSFVGQSFNIKEMKMDFVDSTSLFDGGLCSFGKWNKSNSATNKIVLCFSTVGQVSSTAAAYAVLQANGSALIFAEPFTKQNLQDDFLPTIHVDLYQATQMLYYIRSTRNSTVHISPSKTEIDHVPAPKVAYFSSRGPSSATPNILKPDIIAPGENILAAWSPKSSPTLLPFDDRSVDWNFDSGTSMSCPHVSGIVALIKSAHPDWSPAAIKSALMTTAYMSDTSSETILAGGTLKPVDPFDIGAGHINPLKAMDPGLVYDIEARDHVLFLCSIGYSKEQINRMVVPSSGLDISCTGNHSDTDLNYPAITISDLRWTTTVKRTLTNVGHGHALYYPIITSPQGVHTWVWPNRLVFKYYKEKLSYFLTVAPAKQSTSRYDFGEIVWSDGYHHVRIPLIVRVNNEKNGDFDCGGDESRSSA
ncbi:Subtilisin-like protease SBT3.3 [Rhynchospora pubera]|uniref:Subtilisin-like protease SBT3.3 n=1 Tax=Rhynchospora pubera TaxID=906938 RepID=A0AAV8C5C9_9POAL|nr:Subtilisin-like protease SBT3.3 [Rhynchospora pubera]